jgi:hypothetical protein
MTFGSPFVALFLLLLPPLLYWRARAAGRRSMRSTTTAVWRRLLEETESTARRRFRVSPEVLLEGVALACLLLCAAGPRIAKSGAGTALLIEDGAASATEMRRKEIRDIVAELETNSEDLRIYRVGAGRFEEISDVDSSGQIIGALPSVVDWQRAVARAGENADRVVVAAGELSQEIRDRIEKSVRIVGLRSEIANCGLTAVFLRTDPESGRTVALCTVEKTKSTPSGAVVCAARVGVDVAKKTIEIAAGGRATFEIELPSAAIESATVEISPAATAAFRDEIAADDRVLILPERAARRALVAGGLDVFADALSCLDFDVVGGQGKESDGYDLVVAETEMSGAAASIVVTPKSTASFHLGEIRPLAEFSLRVADGVAIEWRTTARARGSIAPIDVQKSGARPLFFADDAVFVAISDLRKSICIAADARATPFFERPDFPIFLRAVVESLPSSAKGRRFAVPRAGGDYELFGADRTGEVRFVGGDGRSAEVPTAADTALGRVFLPFLGRYEIGAAGKRRTIETAVLDPAATRAAIGADSAIAPATAARERDLSAFFAILLLGAALALLGLRGAAGRRRSNDFDGVLSR